MSEWRNPELEWGASRIQGILQECSIDVDSIGFPQSDKWKEDEKISILLSIEDLECSLSALREEIRRTDN